MDTERAMDLAHEASDELATLETRLPEDHKEIIEPWAEAMSAINDALALDPPETVPLRDCLRRALNAVIDLDHMLPPIGEDWDNLRGPTHAARRAVSEALRLALGRSSL
jgi:hypothetical protein